MQKKMWWLVAFAVMGMAGPALADDPVEQMRQMLTTGRATEAYRLGQQHGQRLGDADFDLIFGLAALEGGRASEGVLALERYRMSNPGDDAAWLALTRGYILLTEYGRARAELEDFLAAQPDESLAKVAREYLDVVRIREEERLASSRAWLEAGLGYDSNVNGGPGTNVVNLPIFGRIALDDNLTETGDALATLAGGVSHQRLLQPGLTAFVEADAGLRDHFDEDDYNQANIGAKGGLLLNRGGMLWRAALSHQSLWLDGSRYRSVHGLGGEWINPFAADRAVSAFLQYARFDYGEKGGSSRDADFYGGGLGWRQSFSGEWKPRLTIALTAGEERNDRDRDDLSRTLLGGGIQLNLTPASQWGVHAGYSLQLSHYGDDDPFLLMTRKDDNHALNAGITYLVNRQWSVRGELSHTINESNIELNDYKRTQAMIKLRYDFR